MGQVRKWQKGWETLVSCIVIIVKTVAVYYFWECPSNRIISSIGSEQDYNYFIRVLA